jgi:hypothetical protein
MPYALLPGSRTAFTRTQTFVPVGVAIVFAIAGIGYFSFRPGTSPAPQSSNLTGPAISHSEIKTNNDRAASSQHAHRRSRSCRSNQSRPPSDRSRRPFAR